MEYKLIRSARRTISAEILSDGSLLVRAPQFCPRALIDDFLDQKKRLLDTYREKVKNAPAVPVISSEELLRLKKKTREIIFMRLESLSKATGLSYSDVKITSARHRLGSCSGENRLCFSAFLSLASKEEIDYVILHELCHTVEHNHSPRFYQLVAKYMPNWKSVEAGLKKIIIPEIKR